MESTKTIALEAREALGITQAEMSRLLGIDASTTSRREIGAMEITRSARAAYEIIRIAARASRVAAISAMSRPTEKSEASAMLAAASMCRAGGLGDRIDEVWSK